MAYSSRASLLAIAATSLLAGNCANALDLTEANFSEMTSGKTIFLKMYAPWCGHCKSMAGDWAKLEADFEGHPVALVGSVDCTDEKSEGICQDFKVQGFPSLVWGDVHAAESYEGARSYDAMKAFADENVTKPACSIFNQDACDDAQKAAIQAVDAKPDDELIQTAQEIADATKAEEKKYEQYIEKLQDDFEKFTDEHEKAIDDIKAKHNYKVIQQVFAKRGIKDPIKEMDDDDDDDLMDDDDDMMAGGEL